MTQKKENKKLPFIKKSDIAILLIALIGPLAIVGAQFSKYEPHVAIYKIVNGDGWDNAAHVSYLQVNGQYGSYIYPASKKTNNGSAVASSYPQGWHLASSNLANGFGQTVFGNDRTSVFVLLMAYALLVIIWYIIALFLYLKCVMWYASYKNVKRDSITPMAFSLIAVSMLPVLILFIPSVFMGFINFIAIMPFIILSIAASVQYIKDKKLNMYFAITLPVLIGLLLTWTLPLPGMLLVFLSVVVFNSRWNEVMLLIKTPSLLLSGLVVVAISCWYTVILSNDIGFGQVYVNTGFVAGFPHPEMLLILVTIILVGIYKKMTEITFRQFILILAPLTIYMTALWLLSYIKSDTIGYYQSKMLAVIAIILMTFASAIIVNVTKMIYDKMTNHQLKWLASIGVSMAIVGSIIMLSNNPLNLQILKRDDWNSDAFRMGIIQWVFNDNRPVGSRLIVLSDQFNVGYNRAMLFNQLDVSYGREFNTIKKTDDESLNPLACVSPFGLFYIGVTGMYSNEQIVKRINNCINARNDNGLSTEILSDESNKELLKSLDTRDIIIKYIK